jgi:hypothetical protein
MSSNELIQVSAAIVASLAMLFLLVLVIQWGWGYHKPSAIREVTGGITLNRVTAGRSIQVKNARGGVKVVANDSGFLVEVDEGATFDGVVNGKRLTLAPKKGEGKTVRRGPGPG